MKELRLYTQEVVELNEEVSFIILMPSIDRVCMPPGSDDVLLDYPNTMSVPIHLFQFGETGSRCGHVCLCVYQCAGVSIV